jgi:transcriptional regulator with XRE-family HTH domain
MTFNLVKLANMAEPQSEKEKEQVRHRKENREWLRMSQEIALCLHYYLRTSGTTQRELADKMGVSAVYVGKLLKGGENMTLETICKIQKAIDKALVTVAKPYVYNTIVSIPVWTRFSSDATMSEKYSDNQSSHDNYVPMANDAA